MKTKSWALVLTLCVGGCADSADGGAGGAADSESEAINGGKHLTDATHGVPDTSVVKLEVSVPGGVKTCSALKFGARTFWTAGSCLEGLVSGQVRVTNNLAGNFVALGGYTLNIESFAVHPSRLSYSNSIAGPQVPRHFDVGRLDVSQDSPLIPSYSNTHGAWMAPNQSVTYTAYGLDPETQGKKEYAHFPIISETEFDNYTSYEAADVAAIYSHHMVKAPGTPSSGLGDAGAPVFQNFASVWKVVGIVPEVQTDTVFVRFGNVSNWLNAPAMNQFQAGFQGFLFNKASGYCLTDVSGSERPNGKSCDGRLQDFDPQSWRLVAWGTESGAFQIVGRDGSCLEVGAPVPVRSLLRRPGRA
jgi:hypothetical protein